MKIAVAVLDDESVATHGGQARHFLLFDAAAADPVPVGRMDLGPAALLHHFGDCRPHPIDGVAVVIAGPSGEGFVKHMARRGIECVLTAETDPLQSVRDWLAGTVKPAASMHHPHINPHGGQHHRDPNGHSRGVERLDTEPVRTGR